MNSRIDAIQNRVGDIIQNVSQKISRFESGPQQGRAAAFLNRQTGSGGDRAAAPANSMDPASATAYSAPKMTGANSRGFSAELEQMIEQEARSQAVSPDLIRAVVQAESGGSPTAVSGAGAIGLMQLMPDTARQLGVDPKDPRQNLRGGVKYLNQMAGKFGDLDLALAAYNAGPGAVKKYGGVPPYRETQDYISRIRRTLDETSR